MNPLRQLGARYGHSGSMVAIVFYAFFGACVLAGGAIGAVGFLLGRWIRLRRTR